MQMLDKKFLTYSQFWQILAGALLKTDEVYQDGRGGACNSRIGISIVIQDQFPDSTDPNNSWARRSGIFSGKKIDVIPAPLKKPWISVYPRLLFILYEFFHKGKVPVASIFVYPGDKFNDESHKLSFVTSFTV